MRKVAFILIVCLITMQALPMGNMVQRAYGTCAAHGGPPSVTPKTIPIDPTPSYTGTILSGEGARKMLELQQDANLVHQQAAYVEKHLDDWSYLAADTVGKVGYVAQKLVGPLGLVDVVGTTVRVGVWVEEGGLRRTADSVKDTAQRAADSVRDTAQKTSDYVKDAIKNTARDVDAGMRNWARNASGY